MKLPSGYVPGQGVVKATGKGGMGERLLRNMGWQDGQGLGKAGQGMVEALQVKRKEDTVGVGGNNSWKWEEKWWENAFDSAAKTAIAPLHSSDGSSSEDEDEQQQKPVCRLNRDGTRSTGSVLELKLLEELTEEVGKVAAGRFAGRGGKMARIRAQELENASKAAQKLELETLQSSTSAASLQDSQDSSETNHVWMHTCAHKGIKASRKRKENPEQRAADSVKTSEDENGGCLEKAEWWGAHIFISAGCLNGLSEERRRKRSNFDEDEQARIYNQAHLGKTQGKVGLGKGKRGIEKNSTRWTGTKVTFDEGDDEKGKIPRAKKSLQCGLLKWKKMIKSIFSSEDASKLKLKALCQAVVPLVEKKLNWKPELTDVEAHIEGLLSSKSSKFVKDGKYVKLRDRRKKATS